ncbi:hypothetical protein BDR07DRAFT_1608207 [Suillus spraguei]|nr:hypothetical protein BDR07DRAFT_1608207 [Suillus spraguei]
MAIPQKHIGMVRNSASLLKLAFRDGSFTTIAIIGFSAPHTSSTTDEWKHHLLRTAFLPLAGRMVLHQERFRNIQESQRGDVNDPSQWTETIEVDLDDVEPFDDPDAPPMSPSGLEVQSTNVSIPFDSRSDAGTRDITDEHLYKWEDELRTVHAHRKMHE